MTHAERRVCRQCGERPTRSRAPNCFYCVECAASRIREVKRAWQAGWRLRNKRTFDRDEQSQRAAAAFTSDFSRIVMSPEERQDDDQGEGT